MTQFILDFFGSETSTTVGNLVEAANSGPVYPLVDPAMNPNGASGYYNSNMRVASWELQDLTVLDSDVGPPDPGYQYRYRLMDGYSNTLHTFYTDGSGTVEDISGVDLIYRIVFYDQFDNAGGLVSFGRFNETVTQKNDGSEVSLDRDQVLI